MAAMRDLVVHVNDEVVSGHAVGLAAVLALEWRARLTAVLVADPPNAGIGLSAETAALAHQIDQSQREALLAVGERLAARTLARHSISIELHCAHGEAAEVLQARGRTADLLITSQRDSSGAGGLSVAQSARLLVGSACPVLTVPYIGWHAGSVEPSGGSALRRILVAWSGTRESARAVRDALPLLARATQVDLVCFAGTGRDEVAAQRASLQLAADFLGRHGVRATTNVLGQADPSVGERVRGGWVPDVAVAQALLSHAADVHADLIVMGAYGHSRLWELVLGGVTRSMLTSMTIPVLMSH